MHAHIKCVYTFVFAFLCFLHHASNNSVLTFIATRSFFFYPEIADVERNEIERKRRRRRKKETRKIL